MFLPHYRDKLANEMEKWVKGSHDGFNLAVHLPTVLKGTKSRVFKENGERVRPRGKTRQ